jgi:hypothetical protein
MASWKESLKVGDVFERFVKIDIWRKTKLKSTKNEVAANLKLYDLILENDLTIECKYDKKGKESGNICIETRCNGKKSGIMTTTADYWVITDGEKTFLIKTKEIKRCIYEGFTALFPNEPTKFLHMKKYPVKQEDGVTKLMDFFTIPMRIFSEYCVEVEDIDKMTYKELQ